MSGIFLRKSGLDKTIGLNLVLFSVIPCILVVVFVSNYLFSSYKNKLTSEVSQSLKLMGDGINYDMAQFIKQSSTLITSKDFIPSINRPDFANSPVQLLDFQTLLENRNNNPDFNQFQFVLDGYDGLMGIYIESLQQQSSEDRAFITEHGLTASLAAVVWQPRLRVLESQTYMVFYRNISPFCIYKGVLRVNVPYSIVTSRLKEIEGLFPRVRFRHNLEPSAILNQDQDTKMSRSDKRIAATQLYDGSRIEAFVDPSLYRERLFQVAGWMSGVLILIVIFSIYTSRLTARRITGDFNRFVNTIRNNESFLLSESVIEVSPSSEDIFFIQQKFIDTLRRLNDIYSDLMATRDANFKLEMELLLARLNPHLLYNTLSVIKWDALKRNDQRTADIIGHMTTYYRIALKKDDQAVLVMKELDMIRMYVWIISFTHAQDYQLAIETDEEAISRKTPKHLLQPIVENAVIHGLNGRKDPKLEVRIREEGGNLILVVSDNGRGMNEETKKRILDPEYNPEYGGYGLKNIRKRLEIYNGDDRGFILESELGAGTKVTLRLRLDRVEG